jgi:ribosome-associated protein
MGRSGRIDPEHLHAVHWRERLIAEGFDAIETFLAEFPDADPRELKRLIQKARAMRRHGTPRFLVAYIRGLEAAKRATTDTTEA